MKIQLTKSLSLLLCLFCFGIGTYAQSIKWTEGLSWEQVKAKAKAENKYIFVDCYATWCGPCKVMDKDVYPLDIVGQAMNDKFISVKVQMDSVESDPINIKQLYPTAGAFERDYKISGFPSYLFFAPDGTVLHKGTGSKTPDEFIQLIRDSLDPYKQLFTQAKILREGKMDINLVPTFIQRIKDSGEKEIALELAGVFMRNHLEKLPDVDFITKRNIDFMIAYSRMLTSKDRIFTSFSANAKSIDSLIRPGFSDAGIHYILGRELVQAVYEKAIITGIEPDWKSMFNKLSRQTTTKHSDNIILFWKCNWYKEQKDWTNYAKYLFEKSRRIKLYSDSSQSNILELNSVAWNLFKYSFDHEALKLGLVWVDKAIALWAKPNDSDMLFDTKANLLYKLGRKDEAINLQTKVVLSSPDNPQMKAALDKMKHNEPTWSFGVSKNKIQSVKLNK
jgi:thioredoxin-related protein